MGSGTRRIALVTMIAAAVVLLLTLVLRDPATTDDPATVAATNASTSAPAPTSTPTPNPFAVSATDDSITVTRLWSPAPNTAQAKGSISTTSMTVPVVANGQTLSPITINAEADGTFSIDIAGLAPGPQEICLADACQRVLVAGPGQEDRSEIDDRIDQALDRVSDRFDLDQLIPGWGFRIAGPNSSVGGSANPDTKTITINANSGRSLDDYEITVLHEIAHAIDAVWMNDETRSQFRALRQHDPALPWGSVEPFATGGDRWADSAEDFAEVFVAWAQNNNYLIMTTTIAAQPTDEDLRAFCTLVNAGPLDCGSF